MPDDITAQCDISIDATRDEVWSALTDPEKIQRYYMGARVDTDWREGHPITWTGEWQGRAYEDHGEVLTFDPGRELRYSHWSPMGGSESRPENYHVVGVTLEAVERDATLVRLTQSNADGRVTDADREHRRDYESNWRSVLEGLKVVAESRAR